MRRWLLLVIPTLLLIGLLLAGQALRGQHYVLPAVPGAVIYAAAFTDGAAFNADWDQYDDGQLAASMTADALTLRVDRGGAAAFSSAAPHFGDFDMQVTLRAVAGPVDNGFGVIFRLQDNDNTAIGDDRYYAFQISSDGYYRLVRRVDGTEREVSTWIAADFIRPGLDAINTIRVVAVGAQFRFFINGQPAPLCIPDDPNGRSVYFMDTCRDGQMLDVWTDSAIPHGQIGIVALATDSGGGGVTVRAEDVIVWGIDRLPEGTP